MGQDNYFHHPRIDLVCHIPESSSKILEIGCGAGATGREIRTRFGDDLEMIGVELDHHAAGLARDYFDEVITGDISQLDLTDHEGYFDCILYGDILEHLVDPWSLIKAHTRLLSRQGCMIASIPNIAYFNVIKMLKRGEWTYQNAGIMDRTHLRFFTLRSIIDMFTQAGMHSTVVGRRYGGNSFLRKLGLMKSSRYVQQYIIHAVAQDEKSLQSF